MSMFSLRLLARSPGRTLVRALVLAVSAALLGAMMLFVGHSLRTMTAGAVRGVPLDWQGPVGSEAAAVRAAAGVARQPGIRAAAPAATAPFAAAEHRSAAGTIRAGNGAILAASGIRTFRLLRGSLGGGGVVLDQQLAATLQAQVGDSVSLTLGSGTPPVRLRVTGVAIVSAADVLFQPLSPLAGPAPAQPPANIAIVPFDLFARRLAPLLASLPASSAAAASVPGVPTGIQWQVHAQVDPAALGGSPRHAYDLANRLRNRVERSLPGQVQFVDNLSDALSSAAGDALYAEAIYIMLAVPGALVGLGLAYLAALGTADRDRRTLRLLHARGASRRRLLGLAAVESAALGLVAGLAGAGGALLAVRWVVGGTIGAWPWALAGCVVVAFAGAFAARVAITLRALASEDRRGTPLWERLWLDVLALVGAGLVYWLTARTGFSAVVNPDSNPTLSLSVYMFLAPALLWIGTTLLLLRLRGAVFRALAPRRAATPAAFLLASVARRAAAINRGLLLVGLLLAFAVELALFSATWNAQAAVDAQLTLGADVVVTGAHPPARKIAAVPGVAAVSGVDHTYAYVGPDLQDTFGVDPATIGRATTLRDSYFVGGTARQVLDRLAATRDGVIVSNETITDYSLATGDLVKLRTLDRRTHRFHVVPFHVVGIVQEFPSAPKDSFMVANLAYLRQVTGDPAPNVVVVRAKGDPVALSRRIAAATANDGVSVENIREQTAQTVSSITTVDLRGISRIEEAFALLLAGGAVALYVSVALAERRHELATMAALGAAVTRVSAFLWSELLLLVAAAAALAALLGWLLAEMLVAMLRHAFDPPPDHVSAPWGFLAALAVVVVGGGAVSGLAASAAVRRLPLASILREE